MKLWADCIPCILKMAVQVARIALKDEGKVRTFMSEIMTHRVLRGEDWNAISPEVVRDVWLRLSEITGDQDPLKEVKARQNQKALELLPAAKEAVLRSADPLFLAIKFAIAGNALDAMVGAEAAPGLDFVKRVESLHMNPDHVALFRKRLERATKALYFTDNCGEIVFDRLLVEIIKKQNPLQVCLITRALPILNDATVEDARALGFEEIARVMDNGIQEPFAGTLLSKVSAEVKQLVAESDLMIAKGVGNYDSLTEEVTLQGKITFMFHGKCDPMCISQEASPGDLIVANA
jgi:uncharacterized protein with ATP-grasp and redox domains